MVNEINQDFWQSKASQSTPYATGSAEFAEVQFSTYVRSSTNPILVSDLEGNVMEVNFAAKRLLTQLGMEPLGSLLPANHRDLVSRCSQGGLRKCTFEVTVHHRTLSWTYHPFPAMGLIYLHGIDITGYRQAEAMLLQVVADTLELGKLALNRLETCRSALGKSVNSPFSSVAADEGLSQPDSPDFVVLMDGSVSSPSRHPNSVEGR